MGVVGELEEVLEEALEEEAVVIFNATAKRRKHHETRIKGVHFLLRCFFGWVGCLLLYGLLIVSIETKSMAMT